MSFITPAAKVFYNHQDHLGSTAVVTDKDSYLNQVLSYQPYGATRVSTQYGTLTQPNQFIGQDFDPESSLSYLNARYYNSNQGQFVSQDPIFWSNKQNLGNPQTLNSYSYASNNPINFSDPSGLATTKGSLEEIKKSFIDILKGYKDFLQSSKADKVKTVKAAGKSVGNTVRNIITNPGGMAYDGAVLARDNIKKFGSGNDAVQDQMIGGAVVSLAGYLVPGKVFGKALPNYTKSSLARGRAEHNIYRAAENDQISGFKEYTFENGRRADFISINRNTGAGVIFELKPNNPRSITAGNNQLNAYQTAASTESFFQRQGINSWSTQLDTY